MKVVYILFLMLLLSCKDQEGKESLVKNEENVAVKHEMNQKETIYVSFLEPRNEFPMDSTNTEINELRLHVQQQVDFDYTYYISGNDLKSLSRNWRFISYTKSANYVWNFTSNGKSFKAHPNDDFFIKYEDLLSTIDSLNVFSLSDMRDLDSFGRSIYYILEMKINGVYKELYYEPISVEERKVFKKVEDAFRSICPPAIEPRR